MTKQSLLDRVMEQLRSYHSVIDLAPYYTQAEPKQTHLLSYQMLTTYRTYVEKKIKDPIRKALITGKSFTQLIGVIKVAVSRLPTITDKNTAFKNTHNLAKVEERFFEFEKNPNHPRGVKEYPNFGRDSMFRAVFKMFEAEYEHDGYYRWRADWFIEQVIIMVLTGEWLSRPQGWPHPKWWREEKPHGGEHTIISALQKHRKEIVELLGDEWSVLREGDYDEFNSRHKPREVTEFDESPGW